MDITEALARRPPPPAAAPGAPGYVLSRWLFLRAVGVTYFVAFVSLAVQVSGLIGVHGMLPAGPYLERAHAYYGAAAYRLLPTLCWLGAGDGMLRGLCWGGATLAALLVAGVAQAPVLLLLWVCYLSLSVAGQTFLWFQWDGLLLETGLVAILYAPTQLLPSRSERAPLILARWLVWWLLFRLMFLSGITKLVSGDPTWRHLTALDYHFWTQPLPTPLAWYAHRAPAWLHQTMTLGILAIEIVVPWLIFVPERWRRARYVACGLLVAGQVAIAITGNYGFFNLLAVVLCIPLLDDGLLERVMPIRMSAGGVEPRWREYGMRGLAPVLALLTLLAFAREIVQTLPGGGGGPRGTLANPLLAAVEPLRSVNGYGLFRVMTTDRPELVIEGSRDSVHWSEYAFRWKPGDVRRQPAFVAPHMPRLDWQMWFAALDPDRAGPWLAPLLEHILSGTPEVVALLGSNPFPDTPPRYVRLVSYRYRFTTPAERSRSGAWWERERVGYLTPPLTLRGGRLAP